MSDNTYNVYIVGLGGQGVLTIGELLTQAALAKDLAVNFYPTKGMSQRGGFVQGQLRIGTAGMGASLPPRGADLVVAMERSEALKGVRYARSGGDFLLYDDVWGTTAVLTGKTSYPSLEQVQAKIEQSGARLHLLKSSDLPLYQGRPVFANMFILGALIKRTNMRDYFSLADINAAMMAFWPKGAQANLAALTSGYEA